MRGMKYRDVLIEKAAMNLYLALADVNEHLLERLNRRRDGTRIKLRSKRGQLIDSPVEEL